MARQADGDLGASGSGAGNRKLPVLVVLHQEHANLGAVGRWLALHGLGVDIRRPRYQDPLPETLAAHAGAIIFGGPMSVNDPDAYIAHEIDWIGVALKENKPFLGVCLGGQMLARYLGAPVSRDPGKYVEIGYHAIRPTAAGEQLGAWPQRVYQWHNEGFGLPSGAALLASGGDQFPNQAFRYGERAIGLQFHPEMTQALISRWTIHARPNGACLDARLRQAQLEDHLRHGPIVWRWLDATLSGLFENRTNAFSPQIICHSERVVVSNVPAS